MPLVIYQREIGELATLVVWNCTESTTELARLAALSASDLEKLAAMPLEKRKREWLATKILFNLISNGRTLWNLPNGKPMLSPNGHISISHSGNLAGLVFSIEPVGLDIQGVDEKISRIRQKFCNPKELEYHSGNAYELEELTVIWGVKEAIFKYFGEEVDFANHISVLPFQHLQEEVKAFYKGVHGERNFTLTNMTYTGYHIVICTNR
jgi:phosphopantetheinyl transferase